MNRWRLYKLGQLWYLTKCLLRILFYCAFLKFFLSIDLCFFIHVVAAHVFSSNAELVIPKGIATNQPNWNTCSNIKIYISNSSM